MQPLVSFLTALGDGFKFVFLNFHDKGDQEAWVELTHSYQKKKLKCK